MPRYAAVDVGTNSTRLLIADIEAGRLVPVHRRLEITRLGQGLGLCRNKLDPAAVSRTAAVLEVFSTVIAAYQADGIRAVATSAVRDAENAPEFTNLIRERTGLRLEVISGEEEAFLSYLGATAGFASSNLAVVDIGGGSTELIWAASGKPVCRSLDLGAVRLTEQGMTLPETLADLERVFREIALEPGPNLVGVGGTITTLAAIDQRLSVYDPGKTHGYFLSRQAAENLLAFLSSLTLAERRRVPGLQPERADIIVAGTVILVALLQGFRSSGITVSEADILHGLILSLSKS